MKFRHTQVVTLFFGTAYASNCQFPWQSQGISHQLRIILFMFIKISCKISLRFFELTFRIAIIYDICFAFSNRLLFCMFCGYNDGTIFCFDEEMIALEISERLNFELACVYLIVSCFDFTKHIYWTQHLVLPVKTTKGFICICYHIQYLGNLSDWKYYVISILLWCNFTSLERPKALIR